MSADPTDEELAARYRPRIEAELADLDAATEATTSDRKPVELDQQSVGRLSRMDAMQQQSMVKANRRTAQTRLIRVETALRRQDNEEYGQCVECEEEIGYARLKAQPEAPFCIECQSNKETRNA